MHRDLGLGYPCPGQSKKASLPTMPRDRRVRLSAASSSVVRVQAVDEIAIVASSTAPCLALARACTSVSTRPILATPPRVRENIPLSAARARLPLWSM